MFNERRKPAGQRPARGNDEHYTLTTDFLDAVNGTTSRLTLPDGRSGHYEFCAIDVARARLIRDLRDEMEVNEAALPVVLALLDQLYDLRRRMREIGDAIDNTVPREVLENLVAHLAKQRL